MAATAALRIVCVVCYHFLCRCRPTLALSLYVCFSALKLPVCYAAVVIIVDDAIRQRHLPCYFAKAQHNTLSTAIVMLLRKSPPPKWSEKLYQRNSNFLTPPHPSVISKRTIVYDSTFCLRRLVQARSTSQEVCQAKRGRDLLKDPRTLNGVHTCRL